MFTIKSKIFTAEIAEFAENKYLISACSAFSAVNFLLSQSFIVKASGMPGFYRRQEIESVLQYICIMLLLGNTHNSLFTFHASRFRAHGHRNS
jgi:hypothetical protein